VTGKRLFLAVDLSMAVTRKIGDAIQKMRPLADRAGMRVGWVPPENLHVTLKFLGWSPDESVDAIRDKVTALAKGRRGFDLGARGVGAFPSETGARVLWMGVQDASGALARLAADVEKAMVGLGFAAETRPYSAHVTVGRVKDGKGGAEVLAPFRDTDFGNSSIRAVVLYESVTKPTGSKYTALFRAPLEGPPPRTERQTRGVEPEPQESEEPNGGQHEQ
jgi:2'-5' RNA ligase